MEYVDFIYENMSSRHIQQFFDELKYKAHRYSGDEEEQKYGSVAEHIPEPVKVKAKQSKPKLEVQKNQAPKTEPNKPPIKTIAESRSGEPKTFLPKNSAPKKEPIKPTKMTIDEPKVVTKPKSEVLNRNAPKKDPRKTELAIKDSQNVERKVESINITDNKENKVKNPNLSAEFYDKSPREKVQELITQFLVPRLVEMQTKLFQKKFMEVSQQIWTSYARFFEIYCNSELPENLSRENFEQYFDKFLLEVDTFSLDKAQLVAFLDCFESSNKTPGDVDTSMRMFDKFINFLDFYVSKRALIFK
jgi:hypothetical protein